MKKMYTIKKLIIVLLTMTLLFVMQGVHAEGLLPTKAEIEGIGLLSLSEALQRYPKSETENEDGSVTELYTYVTDADYETFSVYLTAQGAELGDYRVENGVLMAGLKVGDASFSFSYDSDKCEAKMIYPAGTYNEWTRSSKMLLSSARRYLEEGDIGKAIAEILRIPQNKKYEPVQELLQNDTELATALKAFEEKLVQYQTIGSIVTFGRYEQDSEKEGLEPIEWLVLDYDEKENKALLITCYGLEWMPYDDPGPNSTYETSKLRDWVTGRFINGTFTEREREAILTTEVDNSASQGYAPWKPVNENNTQDKAFILSYEEARKYFGICPIENSAACTIPTAYVMTSEGYQGEATSKDTDVGFWRDYRASSWWLRSPGQGKKDRAYVTSTGVFETGKWVKGDVGWCMLARPAIWLDLNADIF